MTTPSRSLAYKLAQKRLAAPHSRYWGVVSLGLALMNFGLALWEGGGTMNLILGTYFLASAWHEWEVQGLREVLTEQQQLLGEARALAGASLPPASIASAKGAS